MAEVIIPELYVCVLVNQLGFGQANSFIHLIKQVVNEKHWGSSKYMETKKTTVSLQPSIYRFPHHRPIPTTAAVYIKAPYGSFTDHCHVWWYHLNVVTKQISERISFDLIEAMGIAICDTLAFLRHLLDQVRSPLQINRTHLMLFLNTIATNNEN